MGTDQRVAVARRYQAVCVGTAVQPIVQAVGVEHIVAAAAEQQVAVTDDVEIVVP